MKKILLVLLALYSMNVNAGTATARWEHDSKDTSGAIVLLNKFKLYWGLQGQPITNVIEIGPPLPQPISTLNGINTYSFVTTNSEWLAHQNICFEMSALMLDGTTLVESEHTPQVCKLMPVISPKMPAALTIQ